MFATRQSSTPSSSKQTMSNTSQDTPPKQQDQQDDRPKGHSLGERILWILVAIFIVGAIAGMFIADYYNAPGANNARAVKDAADN